ncbi:NrsF family protein [Rhizobium sp. P44RR-XXIV]|uniref:NrsF family protein n=1 Tax=Rhizobium sp. P44RR-XXIV TaxID=1921145 RepID=UPI0026AC5D24
MKTDDLINLLAQDAPVRTRIGKALALAVVAGILISGGIFFAMIGFRADIDTAMQTIRFLFKFVVTIALAATACAVVFRIGRPGVPLRIWGWALLAAPILLLAAAAVEMAVMPADSWSARMIGHNARFCLTLIPLLSIGPLACFLFALRHARRKGLVLPVLLRGLQPAVSPQPSTHPTARTTARSSSCSGIRSRSPW